METFYSVIFIVGVLYTIVSLIISGFGGLHHLGGDTTGLDLHFGHDHTGIHVTGADHGSIHVQTHSHGHVDVDGTNVGSTLLSWLGVLINPMVIVSFLTVFGGLGLTGTNYTEIAAPLVFAGSMGVGVLVSRTLYKHVLLPLYRSENTSNVSKENLLYEVAEVISPIMENGFGEIRYTMNSIRYTAPAKHNTGKQVKQGQQVVICRIDNNVFYVVEFPELEGMEVDDFKIR